MPPIVSSTLQSRNPLGEPVGVGAWRSRALPMFTMPAVDHEPQGILAPGTIRRYVRGLIGLSPGMPAFSWSRNNFDRVAGPIRGRMSAPENYLISTRYVLTYGNQRSNPFAKPTVPNRQLQPVSPLVYHGNAPGRPSVRERILSFGSRVVPLNAYGPDHDSGA